MILITSFRRIGWTTVLVLGCVFALAQGTRPKEDVYVYVGHEAPSDPILEALSRPTIDEDRLNRLSCMIDHVGEIVVVRPPSFLDYGPVEARISMGEYLLKSMASTDSEFVELDKLSDSDKLVFKQFLASSPLRRFGGLTSRDNVTMHLRKTESLKLQDGDRTISITVPQTKDDIAKYPSNFSNAPLSESEIAKFEAEFPTKDYLPDTKKFYSLFAGRAKSTKEKLEMLVKVNQFLSELIMRQDERAEKLDGAISKLGGDGLSASEASTKYASLLEDLAKRVPSAFGASTPDEASAVLARSKILGTSKRVEVGLGGQLPGETRRIAYYVYRSRTRH